MSTYQYFWFGNKIWCTRAALSFSKLSASSGMSKITGTRLHSTGDKGTLTDIMISGHALCFE